LDESTMCLTRLATRLRAHGHAGRRLALALLIASNMVPVVAHCQTPRHPIRTIDLTRKVPDSYQSLRAPGYYAGGVIGTEGVTPTKRVLPILIETGAVRPVGTNPDRGSALEILLVNSGTQPYALPVSRDFSRAHRDGEKGRRTFLFIVRVLSPGPGKPDEQIVGVTAGAETVAGSLIRLEPGQAVRVLLPLYRQSLGRGLPPSTREIGIRVVCKEWTIEDERYYIKTESEETKSENVIQLQLPLTKQGQ